MREVIDKMEFFSGLDRRLLKKVADSAILHQYAKDEVIVHEGENGLGLHIIVRGRVAVTRSQNGGMISLAEFGPEQVFAEMSALDGKPRSATVTTMEETECLLLTRDTFQQLMHRYPELSIRVARVLAERIDVMNGEAAPAIAGHIAPPDVGGAAAGKPSSANGPAGAKGVVQQKLLDVFEMLYTAKAMTRFSVAVLGCPVEGTASNLTEEIRAGEVKALIVPADEAVSMTIEAQGAGWFQLHVFTPEDTRPRRYDPVEIRAGDRFVLNLPQQRLSALPGLRTTEMEA